MFSRCPFSGVIDKEREKSPRRKLLGLEKMIGERCLFLRQEFSHDGFNFFLSVGMTVDGLDDLALLVLGDDAVALEFGFFDFLGALARTDEDVVESDFLTFCLFEIIHDDRDFRAQWSSVEVVVGERRLFGFDGFLGSGSGFRLLGYDGFDEEDGCDCSNGPEHDFFHRLRVEVISKNTMRDDGWEWELRFPSIGFLLQCDRLTHCFFRIAEILPLLLAGRRSWAKVEDD